MFINQNFGFAKTDSINNRGMVQLVAQNNILICKECLKHTSIGIIATSVQDGISTFVEFSEFCLKLFVQVEGTTDSSNRSHAEAIIVNGFLGYLIQSWVICKS